MLDRGQDAMSRVLSTTGLNSIDMLQHGTKECIHMLPGEAERCAQELSSTCTGAAHCSVRLPYARPAGGAHGEEGGGCLGDGQS